MINLACQVLKRVILGGLILGSTVLSTFRCGPSDEDYGPDKQESTEPPPIANLYPYPDMTLLNCPKGTMTSYENFGSAFMSRFCLACHSVKVPPHLRAGAPVETNFDTGADVQRLRALIILRVSAAGKNPMPPTQEIPKAQRSILMEWLDCGAPSLNR
jgi:hypothetical protein